jgi:hypothetical protein
MVIKKLALIIWELLDGGETPKSIEADFTISEERTIERLREAKRGFECGLSVEEISSKTEWKEDSITLFYGWWQDYLRSRQPWSYQKHIDRLADLAGRLRDRIVNPEQPMRPYAGSSVWQWGGQDWRLAPVIWFHVMTPYITDGEELSGPKGQENVGPWGPLLSCLKEHLASSPFWKHYQELKSEAEGLKAEYAQTTKEIAKQDPGFSSAWDSFNDRLTEYFLGEWLPNAKLSPEQAKRLPCPEFCQKLC